MSSVSAIIARPAPTYRYQIQSASSSSSLSSSTAADRWADAFEALQRAAQAQIDAATEQFEAAAAIIDIARPAADQLRGVVDSSVQFSARAAGEMIEQSLAAMRTSGYLPDAEEFGDAVDAAMRGFEAQQFATLEDQQRAALTLAGKLAEIADLADPQKTIAEQQLDYLERMLETAQAQLDAINGNASATLSLAAAMANWQKASGNVLPSLNGIPGFASGGAHTGGLAIVGEAGPELVNVGPSRVWTADQTSQILAGGGNALINEVRELRKEAKSLRDEVKNLRAEAAATAVNTARTRRQLERWDIDGLPAERESA